MNNLRLCILLLMVNTFTLSAAIGFAVYKDKATRLVEEGIISPHRNGSAGAAPESFRSSIHQLDRLPGRLGDFLVKLFEEKIFKIADLCKDNDTRTEVLQKLMNDNSTYECVLEVISEGVPLQHRDYDVDSTDLVKALCLHPRKTEDCYEAGLGPIVRQCLTDGATQAHESLMFLWEKSGNAICHVLFEGTRQAPQNLVLSRCFRSEGVHLSRCIGAFVAGNANLPHLTAGNARETAPQRCRNMVDLMRCSVGVLERCNDTPLSQFVATVFFKTFEYTTCNITESVAAVPVLPDFLVSEHMRSLAESSNLNIIGEVLNFISHLANSEEEETTPTEGDPYLSVGLPTGSILDYSNKVSDFKSFNTSKDSILKNSTIPTERNSSSTDRNSGSTENNSNSTGMNFTFTRTNFTLIGMNFGTTGMNFGTTGMNSNSTWMNRNFTGVNRNSTGVNRNSTGMNRNSTGMNRNSTGMNRNSTGMNSNSTGMHSSTGMHLDSTGMHLDSTGMHLDSTGMHLNSTGMHLNSTGMHLNSTVMHLNSTGMHLNSTGMHLNSTGMHFNSTGMHLNSTEMHLNSTLVNSNSSRVNSNSTAVNSNSTAVNSNSTAVNSNSTAVNSNSTAVNSNSTGMDFTQGTANERSSTNTTLTPR